MMDRAQLKTRMLYRWAAMGLLAALFMLPAAGLLAAEEKSAPEPKAEEVDKLTTPPLDLNLNNADINSVIKFITEHTDKPVVKENSVNAKLTIRAPEKILPYEALDLIYDALRLQGVVVIETETLIQIVPVAEANKFDMMTYSGALPPDVARQKGRLIRRIIQLSNVRASRIKEQLDPLLGKYASVSIDDRTNKIIITDIVRNIERYESIIHELDIIGFEDMEVRIVPLEHADAAAIGQILEQTVVKAAQQSSDPNAGKTGQTIVRPDTRTNSLVIAAPVERMNSIVEFIQRLDVPKQQEVNIHVVQIEFADAQEIARAVTGIFQRTSGGALKDAVEVRATGRDNALLILASDENYKLIMDVIETLDTESAQKRETRKFELKHLDAEDTAKELEQLYSDTKQNNRRNSYVYYFSPWGNNNQDSEVTFVPMSRTNSILVVAPPSEFKLIQELIDEIDKPINVDEVLPKIYRLSYSQAADIVKVLNDVFGLEDSSSGSYYDWWRTDDSDESVVGRLTGKIKFSADENTNSIIAISNNASNYEVVDRMIERLDTSIPELANTMIMTLEHADAVTLANELNSLFGKPIKPDGQQQGEEEQPRSPFTFWWGSDQQKDDARPISNLIEQVRFVPDPRTNSILVTTAAQNFEVIRTLVSELDKEEPQVVISVRIIEVNKGDDQRTGIRWTPDSGTYSPEDLENSIRVMQGLDFIDSFGGQVSDTMSVSRGGLRGTDVTQSLEGTRGVLSSTVNVDLLVQMLLKNLNAQVVISPTLYVSNNQPGHIFVGENIPRLTGTQLTAEGTRNDTYANEDIGITMEVTPSISSNGQVVLNVLLTTAQTTGETRFGSDVIQKREYNTKVAVYGSETMVLGGIRMNTDQEIVRKFPILGDIPLIGGLFRNRVKTESRTDLYAFITPQIIRTKEEAREAVERIESTIGKQMDEDKIPEGLEGELGTSSDEETDR